MKYPQQLRPLLQKLRHKKPEGEHRRPAIPDKSVFVQLPLPARAPQPSAAAPDGDPGVRTRALDAPLAYPSVGQCASHLALLECFSRLRRKVVLSGGLDRVFGTSGEAGGGDAAAWRERKWGLYVELAVGRFAAWWEGVDGVLGPRRGGVGRGVRERLTKEQLPPLDVLMVWHSYMLNPHCFYEDCIRHGKLRLWELGLPWDAIDEVIDKERWIYRLPDSAASLFSSVTSMPAYQLSDWEEEGRGEVVPQIRLNCPFCQTSFPVPLTAAQSPGYSDQSFQASCPECGKTVSKPILEREKFMNDYSNHTRGIKRMPCTVLSSFGELAGQRISPDEPSARFLDELLRAAFSEHPGLSTFATLESIQKLLHQISESAQFVQRNSSWLPSDDRRKRLIDKLLSRYRDNPSVFSLDLGRAVIRQGSFVAKMGNLLWIRSPNLVGTVTRAKDRYRRFFSLLSSYPGQVIVPTLDVDLVWHTHQLCPEEYFAFSVAVCGGRYIDHDDKIPQAGLDTAFQATKRLWAKEFPAAGEYGLCLCWTCERKKDHPPMSDEENEAIRLEVAYYDAVETARREHRRLPRVSE